MAPGQEDLLTREKTPSGGVSADAVVSPLWPSMSRANPSSAGKFIIRLCLGPDPTMSLEFI